jgi:hypothetical protein
MMIRGRCVGAICGMKVALFAMRVIVIVRWSQTKGDNLKFRRRQGRQPEISKIR